jgi:hypothetical protein
LSGGDDLARLVVIFLIFVVAVSIICQVLISKGLMPDPIKSGLFSNEVKPVENLDELPLSPFVLPGCQSKVQFPGSPSRAGSSQQLYPAFSSFGRTWMVADRERRLSAAEFTLNSFDDVNLAKNQDGTGALPTAESIGSLFGSTLVSDRGAIGRDGDNTAGGAAAAKLVEDALSRFAGNWVEDQASTVESKKIVCKNGVFYGRELSGTMKDLSKKYRLKVFCNFDKTSMVMVAVIGTDKGVKSPLAQKFLNSLELW